ncbi:MAG: phosphopyruvate hydratase [Thermoplasmataceae archaeon]
MNDFTIRDVRARKILDSRGNFTIEAEVHLDGVKGIASAASGASTGATEVVAFSANGIDSSINYFRDHARKALIGLNALDQVGVDRILQEIDGTDNFSRLGGNMSTAISMAVAKASSIKLGIPLYSYVGGAMARSIPRPMGNVIGGGKHSKNGTTIQEFLVSSQGSTFLESIYYNALVHRRIGQKLSEKLKGQSVGVGDERAWTANISDEEAIEIVKDSAKEISGEHKVKILLGVDFAATSYFEDGKYVYKNRKLTTDQQVDYATSFVKEHGFYFIEDPIEETDFEGFAAVTSKIGDRALVVGDDIYTTDEKRIKKGIEMKSTNAVLIKVNQIGTLTDTYRAVEASKKAGMKTVISHRSGETTDNYIAHLAVAFGSVFIKTGTIGGERLAKLNELAYIEENLGTANA